MQQLQTVFQVSMTVLVCLSAVIFAAAEEQPLVSLTVPLAIVAWAVVDRPHRAGLGPGWSFALGLLAVAVALWEFFSGGIEARIIAPSHLLAYLIWIILFQQKATRHNWTLLGLTVLQVAIASLLTTASWLGAAAILYASSALWTMGVFTLHRAVQHIAASGASTFDAAAGGGEPRAAGVAERRFVFSHATSSTVRHSVHLDPSERMIGWHFTGGALLMTVLALSLSGMFFLFIPRIWPQHYQLFNNAPMIGARPLTGFSEDVRLGDIGEILENDELVMEVALFDTDSDRPIDHADYANEFGSDDPLFRGQVMEFYSNARWEQVNLEEVFEVRTFYESRTVPWESNTLRQRIRLQPIGSAMLFAAGKALSGRAVDDQERFWFDSATSTLRRPDVADLSRPIEYDVYTSRLDSLSRGLYPWIYQRKCLELSPGLERLQQKAIEIAPPDAVGGVADRAERLVAYLRDSPEFSYSLDLSVQDPSVDPVVDFLFNRKQGHCEYYATALALLLRAVGVPSRVVSGFKGGQLNSQTGLYEVRQLHAHLWVEAYIGGAWVPLDATPAARDQTVSQLQQPPKTVIGRLRNAWERTWTQGVRLSRDDQDRLIYNPIRAGAQDAWDAVRDLGGTLTEFNDLLSSLRGSPRRWISWRGGLAVFVILLLASGLTALCRRLWRLLRRIRGIDGAQGRTAPVVPFYERFCSAAARAGYERAGPQTPREFAGDLVGRLKSRMAPLPAPPLPEFVTEQYYRVRYGNEQLSPEVLQSLQQQLDEFERQLNQGRKSTARHHGAAHPSAR